jgi:hypothetical protein
MKKLFIIFVYLFALSCREETHEPESQCPSMLSFSDALPIQWWLTDCDTFNESAPCGVHDVCWCAPWNCDDFIPIQFTGPEGSELTLFVSDEDGILDEIDIPEVSAGRFEYVLDLSDYCDKKIRLQIAESGSISSGYVVSDLNSYGGWANVSGDPPWRIPTYQLSAKARTSQIMSTTIVAGDDLDITLTASGTNMTPEFEVILMQSYGSTTQTIDFATVSGAETISVTATSNFDQVKVVLKPETFAGGIPGNAIASITGLTIVKTNGPDIISNTSFETPFVLDPWTNEGSGVSWSLSDVSNHAFGSSGTPGAVSKNLRQPLAFEISAGVDVQVTVDFIESNCDLEVGFSDDGSTGWQWFPLVTTGVATGGVLSNDANYIAFRWTSTLVGPGTATGTVQGITSLTADGINVLGSQNIPIPTSGWTESGSGYSWNSSNTTGSAIFPKTEFAVTFLSNGTSALLDRTVSIPEGEDVRYSFEMQTITDEVGSIDIEWTVEYYNGATLVATSSGSLTSETTTVFTGLVSLDQAVNKVRLYATSSGSVQNIELQVNEFGIGPAAALAKTDCLDIKESHACTELFEYSNQRDFAGLAYSEISPNSTFYLRIPCRFFHERFPEEDEAMELLNTNLVTSSQIKTQRLLEIPHVPYYFHKKIQLVLKHRSVYNNDTRWVKEEKYEILEGRKDWPLKAATCYLTQHNSVQRNIL